MARYDPIYVHYIQEITRLHLWYVHKAIREEEVAFEDVVNRRVNIYRNTSLYDGKRHPSKEDVGPEWGEVLKRLKEIYDRHWDDPSTEQFEAEGLDLLWPYLDARIRREGDPLEKLKETDRPYECWSQDYRGDRNNIHIDNLYRPKSPLSEMLIPFAASLIRLLRDSQAQRPDIKIVRCGSWMNSLPPFQKLFPRSWMESSVERREIGYSYGHWGQFQDRRGDFHARNGARFRETGELPFPSLSCECPIEEALDHLKARFPEDVKYNRERAPYERVSGGEDDFQR